MIAADKRLSLREVVENEIMLAVVSGFSEELRVSALFDEVLKIRVRLEVLREAVLAKRSRLDAHDLVFCHRGGAAG